MSGVFDAYASYYDLLYREKDYRAEAEYINSQIRHHAPKATKILELGCGTGAHAEQLARMGYTVHGIDLSEAMLARAQARKDDLPPELAARLTFTQGDIRSIRTEEIYDAVISLFHVMSYQTENADLEAAFSAAATHLKSGGLFLFDFWYGPAVLTQKPAVRVKRLENEDVKITRIAEPLMFFNQNVVEVKYTVFVEMSKIGKVEQIQEIHKMRYLFLPEISWLAINNDLQPSDSSSWMGDDPISEKSWAGFSVLFKL